ncbi:hypothetical protein D3C80_1505220 [compost metagenome]
MPEVAVRIDLITDPLLEDLGFREATVRLALPDLYIVTKNMKDPARAGHQGHFAQVITERAEQFLRQPRCAQQPLALGAIGDDDFRFAGGHGG